jgi:hypothetical protein
VEEISPLPPLATDRVPDVPECDSLPVFRGTSADWQLGGYSSNVRRFALLGVLVVCLAACSSSTSVGATRTAIPHDSIEYRFSHAPGTSAKRCVDTTTITQAVEHIAGATVLEARSDDLLAGNFLSYMVLPGQLIGKFYFNALDRQVPKAHGLSITLLRPGSLVDASTQQFNAGSSTQMSAHPTGGFFWVL